MSQAKLPRMIYTNIRRIDSQMKESVENTVARTVETLQAREYASQASAFKRSVNKNDGIINVDLIHNNSSTQHSALSACTTSRNRTDRTLKFLPGVCNPIRVHKYWKVACRAY
jgi:hypothetical protein